MSFDDSAVATILDEIVSHAMALGRFETVCGHEPKNAPGLGLSCAIWVDTISPVTSSGLARTSGRVTFHVRIYSNMMAEPQDGIDPNLMAATSALMEAYSGDFTLGGNARAVDLLGMSGQALSASAGYIQLGDKLFRAMEITLPVIVNDMWDQVLTTFPAGLPASQEYLTELLPSGDTTGAADVTNIQALLSSASPGSTIRLAAGTFYINAPLRIPPAVTLQGVHGGIAAADTDSTTQKGSVLQITAGFTGTPATVTGGTWQSTSSATITVNAAIAIMDCRAGGWTSYSSTSPNSSIGVFIRDIFIDGQNSPAGIDGIAGYGSVAAVRFSDIGMNKITGNGMIGYIYSISGTFYQPDGWHGQRVIAQNVVGDSFGQFIWVDCTFIDFHAQGGGPGSAAGNGFNINQSSVRLIGCRSEFKQTAFRIQFNSVSGGSFAPIILSGCTVDQSDQNGIWIQSTATSNYQNPVILDNCQVDGAGANAAAGGGGYAGIRVTGRVAAVSISNCQVWSGSGATPGPQLGLVVEQFSSGNHPQSVQVSGGVLNGVTTAFSSDGTAVTCYVDPSVMTVTGSASAGFSYNSDPYESVASFKQVLLNAASTGGMLSLTNTQSAPANPPFQLTAAAAADLLFGFKVTGDTNNRWNSDSNGQLKWGPGNATQDTNLYRASTGLLATDESFQALSGFIKTQRYLATGLTGATAASRWVGATATAAPASGTFLTGDFVIIQSGHIAICTAGGTPGTWTTIP